MIDLLCAFGKNKRATEPLKRSRGANNKHTITMPIASKEVSDCSESTKSRFWRKVVIRGKDECWPWMAAVDKDGYGIFHFNGKKRRANRVALGISMGFLSEDDCACHKCDNPICCNPSHLVAASGEWNNQDKERKGRGVRPTGERHGTHTKPESMRIGIEHHSARLNPDLVRELRLRCDAGEAFVHVGREFSVSEATIRDAFHKKTWRHIV